MQEASRQSSADLNKIKLYDFTVMESGENREETRLGEEADRWLGDSEEVLAGWRMAGKAARATDSRWTKRMLTFNPRHGSGRQQGHPYKRWSDDIDSFAGGDWITHAGDDSFWAALEHRFVNPG